MKLNLLSIIQLCDNGNNVTFDSSVCMVIKTKNNQTLFTSLRSGDTYTPFFYKIPSHGVCLLSKEDK